MMIYVNKKFYENDIINCLNLMYNIQYKDNIDNFCDVYVPSLNLALKILDTKEFPKINNQNLSLQEVEFWISKFSNAYSNNMVIVYTSPKCFSNVLDEFQNFFSNEKLIFLMNPKNICQLIKEYNLIEKKKQKIKKLENHIDLLCSNIQEVGETILTNIPSIEEDDSDYLLSTFNSIYDLVETPIDVLKDQSNLQQVQVEEILKIFF